MMFGFGCGSGMALAIGTAILFWGGLIALVIWGATRIFPRQRTSSATEALEILKTRFARGEINQIEYEQARVTLS